MITATQIRKGMIIVMDDQLYKVMDFQHVTPGKGVACMQTKLRNMTTGNQTENRFRPNDKIEQAFLETKEMEYLYNDGIDYHFMNSETFEQVALAKDFLEDVIPYLKENDKANVEYYNSDPVGVSIANFVILEVTYTEPGAKGNTATNVTKPATLETGCEVNVPIFVNIGEKLKIDTRTGEYIERAK